METIKAKRQITRDFPHIKEHLENAKKAICVGALEEAKYHINLAENMIIKMEQREGEARRKGDERKTT